jgi:mannose/cellobiose epimerase-like protein (N-acyl-D-glucosamine 2-epimerase family)
MTVDFTFSDTVTGYVTAYDDPLLRLRGLDDHPVTLHLTDNTSAELVRNLGEPYLDVSGRLAEHLLPGQLVTSHGPVYPDGDGLTCYSARLLLTADGDGTAAPRHRFERPGWWVGQLERLAEFYRHAQFGDGPVDFADYRTELRLGGHKTEQHVQETDTISRLVYGMATTYLLTGARVYLEVAERGVAYLRRHLRFVDRDEDVVYWYHGTDVAGTVHERKLFTSEFGDDYQAIPAYEQIYALTGLTQTYRATGDPALRADIEGTLRLFHRFFRDPTLGGYYSHLDPHTLSPHAESLGPNRSRKNWNSVGDHAPAYLFNLYLATGDERHLDMLEHTFDMIVAHFPEGQGGDSPFVRERFHDDWTPDHGWGWQQDRAVVGHNLKIAWNLSRMSALRAKHDYTALAARLADSMPGLARDPRRGGWYDMLDRVADHGRHQFVWHDRKAWWQQEQAILAYLILAGRTGDEVCLRHAREAEAFYNAYFLDHDEGGVYFSVLANGEPYLHGTERLKGSHSMSMYHSAELCYLATVYNNLLIHGEPVDLWFNPRGDHDFPGGLLRVAPDALPSGRVRLDRVLLDGTPFDDVDADALVVRLPRDGVEHTVQARLVPVEQKEGSTR